MPGSRSLEALIEKTKATFTGKSGGQSLQSHDVPESQREYSIKSLPKSLSQGLLTSTSSDKELLRGASDLLTEPTAPKLAMRRCHRPFSHCFNRRKTNTDGDNEGSDMPSDALFSVRTVSFCPVENSKQKADCKVVQSNTTTDVNDSNLKARLDHVNAMKGKTYSLHTGFALARKDALEIVGVLRSSVGRLARRERSEVNKADMETFSQLLLMQAKVLSNSCSQMAVEYSSPEELLLTLTHSFHTVCCLTQACMSLVEGLSTDRERRKLVAKVDEMVMNYVCLLKAAEAAAGSSPSDQSVNALTHHSATISTITNSLSHSLKTLLNK